MEAHAIAAEAAEIGALIAARKERAMIYDVDAKERLAKARGLSADAYHLLPYADWVATQQATHA